MRPVIAGVHAILFADDPAAARAFFRDVLELTSVDAGEDWLIFELPPTELACHPGPGWGREIGQQELFLMCHDVRTTVGELEAKGVEFITPIEDEGWGLLTRLKVPGAGLLGLYEPRHPSPLAAFADG